MTERPVEIALAGVGAGLVRAFGEHPIAFAALGLAIVVAAWGALHIAEHRGWRGTAWLVLAACLFGLGCAVSP